MRSLMRRNGNLLPDLPSFFDDLWTKDLFNWSTENTAEGTLPAVNIREDNDNYELEVAAPGLTKKDFHVELNDDKLIISAEKDEKYEENETNYARREFSYQSFKRTFALPERMVNGDKISARYDDGVLHITIPKTEEAKAKSPKQIEIK